MIEIERFLVVAEAILGIDANQLKDRHKDWLRNFYKHPIQRAAVLASRIIRNHELPDGNKRVALLMIDDYLEENGWRLTATPSEIDRTFRALAARQMSEDYFHRWLISRTERQ